MRSAANLGQPADPAVLSKCSLSSAASWRAVQRYACTSSASSLQGHAHSAGPCPAQSIPERGHRLHAYARSSHAPSCEVPRKDHPSGPQVTLFQRHHIHPGPRRWRLLLSPISACHPSARVTRICHVMSRASYGHTRRGARLTAPTTTGWRASTCSHIHLGLLPAESDSGEGCYLLFGKTTSCGTSSRQSERISTSWRAIS
jgi:hypothetical protein